MREDNIQKKLLKIDNYNKNLYFKKYYNKIINIIYKDRLNNIIQKYKYRTLTSKDITDLNNMIKIGDVLNLIFKNKKGE